jgi:hypothetical protein
MSESMLGHLDIKYCHGASLRCILKLVWLLPISAIPSQKTDANVSHWRIIPAYSGKQT